MHFVLLLNFSTFSISGGLSAPIVNATAPSATSGRYVVNCGILDSEIEPDICDNPNTVDTSGGSGVSVLQYGSPW